MTAEQLRATLSRLLRHTPNRPWGEIQVTERQTTTGSEQLHVVVDGEAFNITITKARRTAEP